MHLRYTTVAGIKAVYENLVKNILAGYMDEGKEIKRASGGRVLKLQEHVGEKFCTF